jgi:hypothetical protein
LLLYRASLGEPPKLISKGRSGNIEALGHGQQFVAYGDHPSGAILQWLPHGPDTIARNSLSAVTEEQLAAFLQAAAPLIAAVRANRRLAHHPAIQRAELFGNKHAFRGLVRLVAGAREGERNNLAFWAACRAGEMVSAGLLTTEAAEATIAEAAMRAGLPPIEAEVTARSGVRTGCGGARG